MNGMSKSQAEWKIAMKGKVHDGRKQILKVYNKEKLNNKLLSGKSLSIVTLF